MEKKVKLRPMGRLLNLIEVTGFKMEHQFDDLVFVNNTAFLFQFDQENADYVLLRFNSECEEDAKKEISKVLLEKSKEEEVKLVLDSDFEISQIEGKEEFQIKFQ
ncbi:MAG: hypothetical protein PF541_02790 [Prolixibacteraceae bacterium]|jgi:hypothetical protein|nr:hypothetical protein [Prolixibacteraceae bacterium]